MSYFIRNSSKTFPVKFVFRKLRCFDGSEFLPMSEYSSHLIRNKSRLNEIVREINTKIFFCNALFLSSKLLAILCILCKSPRTAFLLYFLGTADDQWLKIGVMVNLFVSNAPFLYRLKTSENLTVFWRFQRVEKGCIGNE